MPKTVVELLACWQGKFGRYRNVAIWMAVSHCLMWYIWRERNNWRFEDLERSVSDLKLFFLKTLLDCVVVLGFAFFFFGMIRCVGNLQWEEVLMFILVTRF